jgi:two-component system sensor histidine kinase SenX3
MQIINRGKAIALAIVIGSLSAALAIALNISWILQWRGIAALVIGIVLFALIIAGIVLNTIFIVREIRRNAQHDSFVNAVTHELRTPIASIRLHLETLQSRAVSEAQRQEFYRLMHEDTDRLMTNVDQVLRAAESFERRRRQSWTTVDMLALIEECAAVTRRRHHLEPEALRTSGEDFGARGAAVLGDHEELRIAIGNVLDNAAKYSTDPVRISVTIAATREHLLVRVADQGVGIPPVDLKRIFARFYRTGRHRTRIKGTGLGLFIVRNTVRRHGGSVVAESAGEGRGTTITVRLPRAPAT